jgi:hypothetical protein
VILIHNAVLAIRNKDLWFEGKWMQLEDIMLNEVSQDQNTKAACFLSYVEDKSNDKHVNKNKHDHIQTQMQNMSVTVELLYGTWSKREKKSK